MVREAYVLSDTKEAQVQAYWHLDDISNSQRTAYLEKDVEHKLPETGVRLNLMVPQLVEDPYKDLFELIRTGVITHPEIDYSKIFGELYWLLHLEHWLEQVPRHGKYDFRLLGIGKDGIPHHLYEEVAIVAGRTLRQALGDKSGIKRFGYGHAVLEGVKADVTLDLSGRPNASLDTQVRDQALGDMLHHIFPSFANHAGADIVVELKVVDRNRENEHHKGETAFKALALALSQATSFDERYTGQIPSTKGRLD